ncbi:response regulator [Paenibacillus harenae]|uniref:Transcriptional regulatory protein n=1 Tax=Paenibacillus harenae TaxID=306543 RepID=A0ABT9U5H2_PAEHA|nr:response regulator [Paenibacillus harenae]MDQ0063326.1 two-component system CitB family response regulator [Paenibacillus harenae]MDQ0114885.1 two-component system CitB family response regulator [Paenibacillus harenae]
MIRVVIVEDDLRIAQINRRFVEKLEGFEVVGIATDEQQAHEHLDILAPDLVLLDLYFPDMNGLDLLHYIQKKNPLTDVIIITAAKEFDTVREAIRGGVYDFMIKPVVFERFQEKLKSYQKYHQQMTLLGGSNKQVDQEGIDQLLWGAGDRADRDTYLPKGIDKITSEKILAFILGGPEVLTAEELGRMAGFSRTTARRYLEYFVAKGELVADISYGTVGRPERVYKRT